MWRSVPQMPVRSTLIRTSLIADLWLRHFVQPKPRLGILLDERLHPSDRKPYLPAPNEKGLNLPGFSRWMVTLWPGSRFDVRAVEAAGDLAPFDHPPGDGTADIGRRGDLWRNEGNLCQGGADAPGVPVGEMKIGMPTETFSAFSSRMNPRAPRDLRLMILTIGSPRFTTEPARKKISETVPPLAVLRFIRLILSLRICSETGLALLELLQFLEEAVDVGHLSAEP